MYKGITRFELLTKGVDVALNTFDAGLSVRPHAALESPAVEQQHARIALTVSHRHHGIGIFLISQFALKDLRPEAIMFFRQTLQTKSRTGIEVFVGGEIA